MDRALIKKYQDQGLDVLKKIPLYLVRESAGYPSPIPVPTQFEQLATIIGNHPQAQEMRSLALIGAGEGVGVSTVARNLAQALAVSGQNVLLITLDSRAAVVRQPSGRSPAQELLPQIRPQDSYSAVDIPAAMLAQGGDALFSALMTELGARFGRIVWDVPPADRTPSARLVCRGVQGVIMVVHAGRTRWQSAKDALGHLQYSGATVIGVVLNKKKMYIPQWLYRFLFRYGS